MCYFRVLKSRKGVPDKATRKLFSWPVHNDPKGTIKTQMVYKVTEVEKTSDIKKVQKKRKKFKRTRDISVLRSSPPRPSGRGCSGADSDDDWDLPDPSADLRSPIRRAPTVPGLGLSPQPPADTPNRMLERRRAAQGRARGGQLRCRNAGCPETNLTFSSVATRRRHEESRCLSGIPVKKIKETMF